MADLNYKVVTLITKVEEQNAHAATMKSDIDRMMDLLIDMVEIFRTAEPPKEFDVEKKIEEVDPPAAKDVEKVDLTEKSDFETEAATSDHEEDDPEDVQKETADDDQD